MSSAVHRFHFASEEREVYAVGCDEEGGIIDGVDERIEPVDLFVRSFSALPGTEIPGTLRGLY
jgi:hypothetical protein